MNTNVTLEETLWVAMYIYHQPRMNYLSCFFSAIYELILYKHLFLQQFLIYVNDDINLNEPTD